MKAYLIIIFGLMIGLAGCGGGPYYYNPHAVSDTYKLHYEMQRPVQIITPQRQNSMYWQETRARQEYYDSLHPDLFKPIKLK